ncbi:hypothetical protein AVEN_254920-1 [Araneus ventricosus]|uniref:Uncharacterized protein n=1 Tax=Araneus ventricosus TaxID=182803 RepID=A0A4Y2RBX2_ARAVE|nr:hypothetical protein AVEN_254920-1 [Araneus ventricosus]
MTRKLLIQLQMFEDLDAIARYIIGSSVRSESKNHILTCKRSPDMWVALHSVYEQRNEQRLDILYSQLFKYNQREWSPLNFLAYFPKRCCFPSTGLDKKIRTYCNPESNDYQKVCGCRL